MSHSVDVSCIYSRNALFVKTGRYLSYRRDKVRFSASIAQAAGLSAIHLIAAPARMFAFHISLPLTSRIFLPFPGWLVRPRERFNEKEKEKLA